MSAPQPRPLGLVVLALALVRAARCRYRPWLVVAHTTVRYGHMPVVLARYARPGPAVADARARQERLRGVRLEVRHASQFYGVIDRSLSPAYPPYEP